MHAGLSFCQLQKQQILLSSYINSTAASYLPQCQDSGDYSPVQCDLRRRQCWCVDAEGMEVYGTRQQGRPARCKCHHRGPGEAEARGSLPQLTETGEGSPRKGRGPGLPLAKEGVLGRFSPFWFCAVDLSIHRLNKWDFREHQALVPVRDALVRVVGTQAS